MGRLRERCLWQGDARRTAVGGGLPRGPPRGALGGIAGRSAPRVNRQVYDGAFDNRFVTMILAELDPQTHRLTFANAGHERPLIRRADGTVERLELPGSGLPLGVLAEAA